MSDHDIIEGTSVELVPVEHQPTTLFRTDDPLEVVAMATKVADALKGVLSRQGLTKNIQGRSHVLVEGWTTLGSMLGVVPVVVWSRRVDPQTKYDVTVTDRGGRRSQYTVEGWDWEARVEARTLDGRVIGAAEALCSRAESTWAKRDDYALRSMAQTRATSKALRGPLGFIVTLAGYETTPGEEMPADQQSAEQPTNGGGPAKMSAGARRAFIEELEQIPDAGLVLTAAGLSTRSSDWLATDAEKIRQAIDEHAGVSS